MERLKKYILKLENDLLKDEIRQSVEKISELLIDGFIEFTSSGYIYNYSIGQMIDEGTNLHEIEWEIPELKWRK